MIRAWQLVAPNLAVVGAYFLAGKFGLSLAFFHASASAVWPPSGIALAALLLWGYRLWPGIFLGAFLVNITTQGSAATTLGIATGNTLEAVIGAWLVGRYAGGLKAFERARNVFKFVVLAAILSTAVSATLGVTSLSLGGFAAWEDYQHIWLTWWLGDMVGNLIVAPLLVIWLTQPLFPLTAKQFVEGAALLLTVVLIGWFVFFGRLGFGDHFEYFAILPLLWAAFRFGQRGAVTYAFMMSGIALSGTLKGVGPFATPDPNESLLLLQAFMGTVTMTALVFASVAFERKRAEQRLQVQDAVSRMLAESPKLTEAAPKIVQVLCERAGWEVGAIWSLDQNKRELACVEFWHLPASNVPEFESITRRLRFSPGMGLPGRVWSNGESAWIPDVTMESNFPRAPIAVKEGLHAAVGFPIKLGDEILGVIECFSREIREPDDDFLEMVSHIGAQLGQF
ncbi:MAG TPA: MASE1 domain-containing protein, partial [Candidatus Bathyarchaeia archaeon]|nr:MASE1 domain-containing protein [Candidatus Bathyarchaeia archaeon]